MLSSSCRDITIDPTPFSHVALPDALTSYAQLERDWPAESRFGDPIRMHGDLSAGDDEYAALVNTSAAYRGLHDWVYSEDFIRTFLQLFHDSIAAHVASGALLYDPRDLPIEPHPREGRCLLSPGTAPRATNRATPCLFPRLDLGIGRVGYGKVNGGRGIHVDNITRIVSILVYVGPSTAMKGGEHRLYEIRDGRPVIARTYPPLPNFMVASLQSNMAFHDVNPVTSIQGVRRAMYMAVTCTHEIWRPHRDRRLQRLTRNRYAPGPMERWIRRFTGS